jgi:hypothetical protein
VQCVFVCVCAVCVVVYRGGDDEKYRKKN